MLKLNVEFSFIIRINIIFVKEGTLIMFFNYELGLQNLDKERVNINYRVAVRAIIFKDNDLLMVHTNKGDYKFPGGGVNSEESHEEALKREVSEETGRIVDCVNDKVGVIIERKVDDYEVSTVFEMSSHYYICEISNSTTIQQLDDYEAELDFRPVWISVDKAIEINEEIFKEDNKDRNPWVYRDTRVLKEIKERSYEKDKLSR
jgi:8-oxo-dGTP pyrophosphatase MutT (NUDIX family)